MPLYCKLCGQYLLYVKDGGYQQVLDARAAFRAAGG